MRAVIYARFSSENQRDASIDDQVRLCRGLADREGYTVAQVYSDAAVSGSSTMLRPAYQALLEGARKGQFDVVIAEALDRLSRDQEDIAALYKRLKFAGISLITIADGVIGELAVGLKGTMNALYITDLALKTHRGLEGRVLAGKSGGGLCYGYDAVMRHDARGEPIRGDRKINSEQAAIIRRIFTLFAEAHSPRAIARLLNAEGVPGPKGREWSDTTLRGHAARGTGILRNRLYIGELTWNRMHFVKDPDTGKRVSRPNEPAKIITTMVPDLRIVEQAIWERVQARLAVIADSPRAQAIKQTRFWEHRRPKHLLTGLIQCGCCGAAMSSVGKDYLACPSARRKGSCDNTGSIRREIVESMVLDGLRDHMMEPDLVQVFMEAFINEVNKANADIDATRSAKERQLASVITQLDRLIEAICNGLKSDDLQTKLDDLGQRKAALTAELAAPAMKTPRLHPNLAGLYRNKVAALREALNDDAGRGQAAEILRDLIERVTLRPAALGTKNSGFEIELKGAIASMVMLANDDSAKRDRPQIDRGPVRDVFERSVKVVAGAGFEPAAFRL